MQHHKGIPIRQTKGAIPLIGLNLSSLHDGRCGKSLELTFSSVFFRDDLGAIRKNCATKQRRFFFWGTFELAAFATTSLAMFCSLGALVIFIASCRSGYSATALLSECYYRHYGSSNPDQPIALGVSQSPENSTTCCFSTRLPCRAPFPAQSAFAKMETSSRNRDLQKHEGGPPIRRAHMLGVWT